MIGKLLPGWFPRLPSQSQYNRRLRRLTPKLVWVQQRLSELLATGRLRLADGVAYDGREFHIKPLVGLC